MERRITRSTALELQQVANLKVDARSIDWNFDGKEIALTFWEKPVEVLDSATLKPMRTIGKDRKLIHFAYSPDGKQVAFCENGKVAEILEVQSGRILRLATGNDQPGLAFSPDGKLLATGGYGTAVRIWDAWSGILMKSLEIGTTEGGLTALFSPDGKKLAVGNRNSTSWIFDVQTWQVLFTLEKSMSHGLRFSPDGTKLAVAYVDGRIGLWSMIDGRLLEMKKSSAEELYRVAWSPDGTLLASAGLNGSITLWDPRDLSVVKDFKTQPWVICIKFSPDGSRLITAGGGPWLVDAPGREVKIWGLAGAK